MDKFQVLQNKNRVHVLPKFVEFDPTEEADGAEEAVDGSLVWLVCGYAQIAQILPCSTNKKHIVELFKNFMLKVIQGYNS